MISPDLPAAADVVVVGAGVVGAACAAALARAGSKVCVIDLAVPARGSSSSGEGNLLVSDKLPGPELELALHSLELWRAFAQRSPTPFEFESKGGLVVARTSAARDALVATARDQHCAGVDVTPVAGDELAELEPRLAPGLAGGAYYPQDCQVQPMRAVWALLNEAVDHGASVVAACAMLRVTQTGGAVDSVVTTKGNVAARRVVIATGAHSAEVAERAGASAPVRPRRGHILVTEPLPIMVRHKVYEAGYVADVESDDAGLRCSAVVEGTESGPLLLGSSRELVGFNQQIDPEVVATIARRAIDLFPFLADVRIIRSYVGFRPATPDHLPIIGEHPAVPGVWLATGHEGAGVGLAMGTADLIRAQLHGERPALDAAAFRPERPSLVARTADV